MRPAGPISGNRKAGTLRKSGRPKWVYTMNDTVSQSDENSIVEAPRHGDLIAESLATKPTPTTPTVRRPSGSGFFADAPNPPNPREVAPTSEPTDPDAIKVACTIVEASVPQTKTITINADGSPNKAARGSLYLGMARRTEFKGTPRQALASLGARLEGLTSNEVLILAPHSYPSAEVTLRTKDEIKPGVNGFIARTPVFFPLTPGPSFFFKDIDTKEFPPEIRAKVEAAGGLTGAFQSVLPAFGNAARLSRMSASAGWVNRETGVGYGDQAGQHRYFVVQDGRKIEAFVKRLFDHLVLADYGYAYVSDSGAISIRTIFDDAASKHTYRLVYEADAILADKRLERVPEERKCQLTGAGLLNTDELQELTEEQRAELEQIKARLKERARPEAARKRAAWCSTRVQKLRARGETEERARLTVDAALSGSVSGSFEVSLDDGRVVTAREILANKAAFHKVTCADPIEPEYGGGRNKAIIYTDGAPNIFSYAHGETRYQLLPEPEDFFSKVTEGSEPIRGVSIPVELGSSGLPMPSKTFIGEIMAITQDDVAVVFAEKYRDDLRYCHDTKAWFVWDGMRWRQDRTDLAFQFARLLGRDMTIGSKAPEMKEVRKRAFAGGVEIFARSDRVFARTAEEWDVDTFLLGTPDGTVDLRTGKLREARPEDGITKLTAVGPSASALCPLWLEFLDQATQGDREYVRFLQQWFGYCLTGDTREHALVFAFGTGGNGKSVAINTATRILGEYACVAAAETFIASKGDKHPTDLAKLRGARLVTASETEQGRAWDEPRIKALTGGDKVSARFMRQDFFEYWPQFKLLIVGNHKPVLQNVDEALKRRVNIAPFVHTPPVKDPRLEEKLRAELPGILRWMIDGCLDWQENGLVRPAIVTGATDEYFATQNTFAQWLEDDCDADPLSPGLWASFNDLYASWTNYAKRTGEAHGGGKAFSETLSNSGFVRVKRGHKKVTGFRGIQLKSSATVDPSSRLGVFE